MKEDYRYNELLLIKARAAVYTLYFTEPVILLPDNVLTLIDKLILLSVIRAKFFAFIYSFFAFARI